MRLIDADALKERILKERDAIPKTVTERYSFGVETPNHHGNLMRGGIRIALRCMEQTPAIDAVPVVRCKECKRCTETEYGLACGHALPTKGLEQYLCFGTDILALVKPDDFCSYGERKDGGG